jgi:hypothetical protein
VTDGDRVGDCIEYAEEADWVKKNCVGFDEWMIGIMRRLFGRTTKLVHFG